MTPTLFLFLIVWAGNPVTGYHQVYVYESDNIEEDCNHMSAKGCVTDKGIIIEQGNSKSETLTFKVVK